MVENSDGSSRASLVLRPRHQSVEQELKQLNKSLEERVAERTSLLTMLCDVASMANTASDAEAAIVFALQRVGTYSAWNCGHAWLPSNDSPGKLLLGHTWYQEGSAVFDEFRQVIAAGPARRADGLVGRVFANGAPEFTTDMAAHLSNYQISPAVFAHIQSVCAFPILAGKNTVGVMEFFAEKHVEPTDEMAAYMATVGTQLGRVIERVQAAQALSKSRERLDLALAASNLGMWDTDLSTGELVVDERWASMLGYSIDEIEPYTIAWDSLIHPDDLSRVERIRSRHVDGLTESFQVDYRLRTKLGVWKWVRSRGRVTQRAQDGEPLRLSGTLRDITERKAMEREVVESTAAEQRRIGQDLHDGIGGELTGIGFMTQGLVHDLRTLGLVEADAAEKIGVELDRVIEQVRLLSHGLNPVDVDRLGLNVALENLATRTTKLHRIACEFRSKTLVEMEDNFVADHLYRIAQEAVTNSVKHGDPLHISVTLECNNNRLTLKVIDDGIGIEEQDGSSQGIGLRNMHYRAGLIGADLRVEPGEQGGTLVSCCLTSDRIGELLALCLTQIPRSVRGSRHRRSSGTNLLPVLSSWQTGSCFLRQGNKPAHA